MSCSQGLARSCCLRVLQRLGLCVVEAVAKFGSGPELKKALRRDIDDLARKKALQVNNASTLCPLG